MFRPFINPYLVTPTEVPVLREVFSDWKIGYGIFDALDEVATMPWAEYAASETLDIEYFGNHSGGKYAAPIVMQLINSETFELTEQDRVLLARIIWTKFRQPWQHLWDTNVVAYNPIHNYNMTDTRTMSKGESEAKVEKIDSVDSTAHGKTTEGVDFTYGLNNIDPNGKRAGRTTTSEGGTTVDTVDSNRKDDTVRASNEVETTTRSGNIGVTTTQQMLSADRELWLWNFFDQVYKDIDSVLSLPIYDPCRV